MAARLRSGRALLLALTGSAVWLTLAAPVRAQCVGDCHGSGMVEINELIIGVNIALGNLPVSMCPSFDCENNGTVPINCLIQGVNNALNGCPTGPTATPTGTATATIPEAATPTATPIVGEATPTNTPETGGCPLAAGQYTTTQGTGGALKVYTFAAFPFPAGGSVVQDVAAASPPDCVHDTVVPFPGGFNAPIFCVPALGYMVNVAQRGCGIGKLDSNGGSDFTVEESNDTSDSSSTCNLPNAGCPPGPPTLGADVSYRTDIKVGNGTPDTCASGGTMNALVSVPVHTVTWQDNSSPDPWMPGSLCLGDGVFNPGPPPTGDTLITEFDQILDFTTDTAHASWADIDGDGCSIAGAGPAGGQPAETGKCIDTSVTPNTVNTVAAGGFGSGSFPNDGSFGNTLPNTVAMTGPFAGAVCPSGAEGDEGPPIINFTGTATRCIP